LIGSCQSTLLKNCQFFSGSFYLIFATIEEVYSE